MSAEEVGKKISDILEQLKGHSKLKLSPSAAKAGDWVEFLGYVRRVDRVETHGSSLRSYLYLDDDTIIHLLNEVPIKVWRALESEHE